MVTQISPKMADLPTKGNSVISRYIFMKSRKNNVIKLLDILLNLTIRDSLAPRHALFSVVFGQGPEWPTHASRSYIKISSHYLLWENIIKLSKIYSAAYLVIPSVEEQMPHSCDLVIFFTYTMVGTRSPKQELGI